MSLIPDVYDLVVNGTGYIFDRSQESSAALGYTPTFIPRTNVQGDYGDNQQDWFFTATQRDWSLGEQQKFFRGSNQDSQRKYWLGSSIDIQTQGQVSLRFPFLTATAPEAAVTVAAGIKSSSLGISDSVVGVGATKLFTITDAGVVTDKGAHGLGATPEKEAIVSDGEDVYISTSGSGSVGVRKWTGSAFSTFSTTKADALEFQNNSLYGLNATTAALNVYDTAGVATELFTWLGADGGVRTSPVFTRVALKAFGGDLAVLWSIGAGSSPGSELWFYNGTGVSLAAVLPTNFEAYEMEVLDGILFISGTYYRAGGGGGVGVRPAILYYAGSEGVLWQGDTSFTSTGPWMGHPSMAVMDGGIVFNDDYTGKFMFYDPASGAISSIGTFTVAGDRPRLAACGRFAVHTRDQTTMYVYPSTTLPSTGFVTSSIFDFESTRQKAFRGITIVFDKPTGTTVDISYRLNDLDSTYTSLQTNAASGTEYTLSGITGSGLSVKVTLNLGAGSASPVLRKVYVRAAPLLTQFRRGSYRVDCSGKDGHTPVQTHNDTSLGRDGYAMLVELAAYAQSTTPLTIQDALGTYTGFIELDTFQAMQISPEEFVVTFQARQV